MRSLGLLALLALAPWLAAAQHPLNQTAAATVPNAAPCISDLSRAPCRVGQGAWARCFASLALADPDIGNDLHGALRVTISAPSGRLRLPASFAVAAVAEVVGVDGAGASLSFTGPLGPAEAALRSVVFEAAADSWGELEASVFVSDQGFTGLGGPRNATMVVRVSVFARAAAPAFSAPVDAITVDEDARSPPLDELLALGSVGGSTGGAAADDNTTFTLRVRASVGTLGPLAGPAEAATDAVTLTGSLAALRLELAGLALWPPRDWHSLLPAPGTAVAAAGSGTGSRARGGGARISATLWAGSAVGATDDVRNGENDGGDGYDDDDSAAPRLDHAATARLRVWVAAVNDAPAWAVPAAPLRTAEDAPLLLGGALAVHDADDAADGSAGGVPGYDDHVRVTLRARHGTLAPAPSDGGGRSVWEATGGDDGDTRSGDGGGGGGWQLAAARAG